uniref:Fungal lipase-like domain-containing protein n=1 Tax=Panagrolaimus davidi TaxID=227884 RepID=A0A914PAD0_9BILA
MFFGAQITVTCDTHHKSDTCSGYIFAAPSLSSIILVFRGSSPENQVKQELHYTIHHPAKKYSLGGHVNGYFYHGFKALWKAGLQQSFLKLHSRYPTFDIIITGHSLGGAMSALAGPKIAQIIVPKKNSINHRKISIYTFGEPRVGDHQFNHVLETAVPEIYRIIHKHDIVAQIPPPGMTPFTKSQYFHHQTEIWYNNDMADEESFMICSKKNECDETFLKTHANINDHLTYFNLKIQLNNLQQCVVAPLSTSTKSSIIRKN